MKILKAIGMVMYRIYQIVIMMPLMLVATLLTSLLVAIGSICFGGRWWGYYPAMVWSRVMTWLTLVTVTVEGRENVERGKSYVFVANHQGAYDIFAVYGWLGHNFKWMMKKGLEAIPFVGFACRRAGHIFVDNRSASAVRRTMEDAEKQISKGMSVVVFPEGTRSRSGHVAKFRRGAYVLAQEFNLPVVPLSIDGAYDVMRHGAVLPRPGHIRLVIHKPIGLGQDGCEKMEDLIERSRDAVLEGLPERFR